MTLFKYLDISREDAGLIFIINSKYIYKFTILLFFAISYTVLASILFHGFKSHDIEVVIFQSSLPGIDEELCFRGVGFALIAKAFPSAKGDMPKWLIPAAVTSTLFFIAHVGVEGDIFSSVSLTIPFQIIVPTAIIAAARINTNSVFVCMIIHNIINVTPIVVGLFFLGG